MEKQYGRRLRAAFFLCLSLLVTYNWWQEVGQWAVPVGSGKGPLLGKVICVDPGHGGRDPGAVSGRVKEKDLNLDIAKRLAAVLKKQGANVVLTRTGDKHRAVRSLQGSLQRAELFQRVSLASREKVDLFLSIHCNSDESDRYYGPQTFYQQDRVDSQRLARAIQQELVGIRKTNRQAIPGNYYLLENNKIPTVIVEVGYLSHNGDRSLLAQASFRQVAAEAIARGVVGYVLGKG